MYIWMGSWVPGPPPLPPHGMVCTLGSGPQGLPQQAPPMGRVPGLQATPSQWNRFQECKLSLLLGGPGGYSGGFWGFLGSKLMVLGTLGCYVERFWL